jgi:hypothetical protein
MQAKWLKLFEELYASPRLRGRLAAPFLSAPPVGYDPSAGRSVLLVGQATKGNWYKPEYLKQRSATERRRRTRDYFRNESPGNSSGFWTFARQLSEQLWGTNDFSNLRNLVWTNVCKLGDIKKNQPGPQIFYPQGDLAKETLRLEIEAYRPKLVVLVTGEFADCWVSAVVGDPEKAPWHSAPTCWWRERRSKMPAMLWTRCHPGRAPLKFRRAWLRRAKLLTA